MSAKDGHDKNLLNGLSLAAQAHLSLLSRINARLIIAVVDLDLVALGSRVRIVIQDLVLIDLNYLSLGSMTLFIRPDAALQ